MKNIEISTKRLLLKPLGSEYLQTVADYSIDSEIKYMLHLPNESVDETVSFLKNVDLEWKKKILNFLNLPFFIGMIT